MTMAYSKMNSDLDDSFLVRDETPYNSVCHAPTIPKGVAFNCDTDRPLLREWTGANEGKKKVLRRKKSSDEKKGLRRNKSFEIDGIRSKEGKSQKQEDGYRRLRGDAKFRSSEPTKSSRSLSPCSSPGSCRSKSMGFGAKAMKNEDMGYDWAAAAAARSKAESVSDMRGPLGSLVMDGSTNKSWLELDLDSGKTKAMGQGRSQKEERRNKGFPLQRSSTVDVMERNMSSSSHSLEADHRRRRGMDSSQRRSNWRISRSSPGSLHQGLMDSSFRNRARRNRNRGGPRSSRSPCRGGGIPSNHGGFSSCLLDSQEESDFTSTRGALAAMSAKTLATAAAAANTAAMAMSLIPQVDSGELDLKDLTQIMHIVDEAERAASDAIVASTALFDNYVEPTRMAADEDLDDDLDNTATTAAMDNSSFSRRSARRGSSSSSSRDSLVKSGKNTGPYIPRSLLLRRSSSEPDLDRGNGRSSHDNKRCPAA